MTPAAQQLAAAMAKLRPGRRRKGDVGTRARLAQTPEQGLGKAVAEYLATVLLPGTFATAINPVPAKSKAAAGLSRAMGLRAGTPDWLIVHAGRALFVELKAPRGYLTIGQRAVWSNIESAGAAVTEARSIDDLRAALIARRIPTREAPLWSADAMAAPGWRL